MRKFLSVLSALVFVVALSFAAYAAEGQAVKGKVISIDPAGKTMVIDTSEGQKTLTLQTSAKGVKPGMDVEVVCMDQGGKSCAKAIKIISPSTTVTNRTVEGQVVSIDPDGKTIVIKTANGKEETVTIKKKPAVEKITVNKGAPVSEKLAVKEADLKDIKPGQTVKIVCFDSEGKSCAKKVTVLPAEPVKITEVSGTVVSIDSAGKSVIIKTKTGEKTVYYQKGTVGTPIEKVAVGKKIKAYCLDVEGKSCIREVR